MGKLKVGDKITVALRVLKRDEFVEAKIFRIDGPGNRTLHWEGYTPNRENAWPRSGAVREEDEGIWWTAGWDTEEARALRTTIMLKESS